MKEKELERLTKLKEIEKDLYDKGFKNICGIDEAGRGPLAGPVVVAGVIMPQDSMIEGINDSKKVSEKKREKLYDLIIEEAISYSVAIIGHDVIDDINILNATKSGVTKVVDELDLKPDLIIVDALTHINTRGIPYEPIIKGDAKCYNIAAASISFFPISYAFFLLIFFINISYSYNGNIFPAFDITGKMLILGFLPDITSSNIFILLSLLQFI